MSRDAILEAVKEASALTRSQEIESQTSFDLIKIIEELDIPVLFRPLDDMWGAAVTIEEKSGILIKASLPRYLQRFTLAHEIGHIVLGHKNQFDEEVGVSQRATGRSNRPVEEIAADTFASELLAPLKLIRANAERQGWSKENLTEPKYIYQLSLRLGISFEATCWSLVDHNILDHSQANKYSNQDNIVKATKSSFFPRIASRDSHADVWSLSQDDADTQLKARENDIFIIELEERSSAGYLWETADTDVDIVNILNESDMGEEYGSFSSRTIGFTFDSPGVHDVTLRHRRPWNDEAIEEIDFSIDNRGREQKGLPRRIKQGNLTEAKA